ncbi:MAG: Obg family GTPase CgtA [Endomicrobium sp.]|jgi:GTP-binding protein|nr:Obg family GTPase CgtA [Endomicrobium sp.]
MFIDEVIIYLKAGNGGSGGLYFDKQKYSTHKEPTGGHGGRGGDIYFESDLCNNTLSKLTQNLQFIAENGTQGNKYNKSGKSGTDTIIKVPLGTMIWKNEHLIADVTTLGMKLLIAKGGSGGRGNATYKRNPLIAERGSQGESSKVKLDLRLIADVGIIGLTNSGKSSLLSKISNAKPKIADYPFTTLFPNLGVLRNNVKNFIVVDIPAIMKERKLKFLKHIYRTKVLLYVIDYNKDENIYLKYNIINSELTQYSKEIQDKVIIIVLNKIDLCCSQNKFINQFKKYLVKQQYNKIIEVSTVTNQGINSLIKEIVKSLEKIQTINNIHNKSNINIKQYIYKADLQINIANGKFIVTGRKTKPFYTLITKHNNINILKYYYDNIIERLSLKSELKKSGAKHGDIIQIGNYQFTFTDD